MNDDEAPDLGWHVIGGDHLLELLQRCAGGEDPDMVFAEMWANAEHHHEEGDDDV